MRKKWQTKMKLVEPDRGYKKIKREIFEKDENFSGG